MIYPFESRQALTRLFMRLNIFGPSLLAQKCQGLIAHDRYLADCEAGKVTPGKVKGEGSKC